jgi:DNA-binding PadR family transcriptional regulator
MPKSFFIGEFEQLVLLNLLQLGDEAYALPLRQRLGEVTGRTVARGALYRTLERLGQKGLIEWDLEEDVPNRGGHPRRKYRVTSEGIAALKAAREALLELWTGLEEILQ